MRHMVRNIVLPFLILACGISVVALGQPKPPKDVDVSITKVGNVWKAVLTGTTTTEVRVVPGQKVIFHAEGTDVFFQFDNDTLFNGHTKTIKDGKKIVLGVGKVSKGIYTYSAFCVGPMVFAEGDSPPRIIVD